MILILLLFSGVSFGAQKTDLSSFKRPKGIPAPKHNKITPERIRLGRNLFFDPRLSGSQWISCATCHNAALGWEDGLPTAIGHGMKVLGRSTPTILNLAWGELFFWDGRADSLEQQALGPVEAAGEMNMPIGKMLDRLKGIKGYQKLFQTAYPGEGITKDTVAKAIATFERTIVSGKAPFDRWVEGDEKAISTAAKKGFKLFTGKAECSVCHAGWRFTDDGFHDIGVKGNDRGRGSILKDIDSLQFAFKTPTLRNIDLRAPYLHEGSAKTLTDVVEFYNRGGDVRRPSISANVKPLKLSKSEVGQIVAFMETLTSVDAATIVPVLPQ